MTLRKAVFAGQFYPADADDLRSMIQSFDAKPERREKARGIMVPHAGYVYSGLVAGAVYSAVEVPERVIILSTKHRMQGLDLGLWESGRWATPLGEAEIDVELSRRLMKYCPSVEFDDTAHIQEHSGEVQVPFVQYCNPAAKICCMVVRSEKLKDLQEIGRGIAKAVGAVEGEVLVVASTDMSHYVAQETAEKNDRMLIDSILALDEEKMFHDVQRYSISMCGYAPTIAMMVACKEMGSTGGTLVKYATSGDVTGEKAEVVGYAGVVIP